MGDWKEYIIHIIWAFAFAIIAAIIYEKSHNVILLLSISFIAIVTLIIIEFYRRRKEKIGALNEFYTFTGKSSSLTPDVLFEKMRRFNKYYYRRKEDDLIDESLKNKENLLVIGPPLGGKSRAIYEALTNLNEPHGLPVAQRWNIRKQSIR